MKNIATIGAGTMGHALALVHAIGGCSVRLQDINADVLGKAPSLVAAACGTLVESGMISAEAAEAAKDRIRYVATLAEALDEVDLVVEAVVEKADIKQQVYAEIDALAPRSAILASNTSYLDVFPLMPASRADKSLVAHWYTPPYIVDLVDIAPGPACDPANVEAVRALYEGFGKAPLVFERLIPGYIANRLQSALNLECMRMIDEGWVGAAEIDFSIRHGLTERLTILGHMRKLDYTGLEMVRNGMATKSYIPPEQKGGSPTLSRLIDEGRTGVRAGAGFYDYPDSSPEALFKDRDLKLLKLKQAIKKIEEE